MIVTLIGENEEGTRAAVDVDKFELSPDGGWLILTRMACPRTGLSSGSPKETKIIRIFPEVASIIITEE